MGCGVDGKQAVAIDFGVNLGRRQGGVAEQFLDLPEIAAGREQMRRKGMAQRVRRCRFRQAERIAQTFHDVAG